MTSESTRDLGEAATIVAEWLNSDDLGHTLLIESIARALRAARSSSTGWVPTSRPPTEMVQAVVTWRDDPSAAHCRAWWNGMAWFSDEAPQGMFEQQPHFYIVIPALPSDGETGGGR